MPLERMFPYGSNFWTGSSTLLTYIYMWGIMPPASKHSTTSCWRLSIMFNVLFISTMLTILVFTQPLFAAEAIEPFPSEVFIKDGLSKSSLPENPADVLNKVVCMGFRDGGHCYAVDGIHAHLNSLELIITIGPMTSGVVRFDLESKEWEFQGQKAQWIKLYESSHK